MKKVQDQMHCLNTMYLISKAYMLWSRDDLPYINAI